MKDITLKITGKQVIDGEEEEQIEFMTEGKMFRRNGNLYVTFDESGVAGMPGGKTTLRLADEVVRMKRMSDEEAGDTVIEFRKGRRYNGVYVTPFGPVVMEVLTNDIVKNLGDGDKGTVDIDYHISLRGLMEGRNLLNIKIM